MAEIERSIEVSVPVRTVYDQWTQFEEFPRFMEGVDHVRQIDDTTLHWKVSIAGVTREWDATIVEQVPDRRVAWTSVEGTHNAGQVSFEPVGPGSTRVTLRLDFEPDGLLEKAADKLGIVGRRAEGDLERFRDFIERRGAETGAWRGEVHTGTAEGTDAPEPAREAPRTTETWD